MKPRTFHCYDICKLPFICPNKLFVTCIQLGSISLTTYKGALFSLLGKELKHNNATHTQTRAHLFPVWKLSLFPHHKTKTACLNLKFHIIETDPCLLRQWSGYFSWGVHKWKGASSWGGESAEGLDERERGSAVWEDSRPPNSLLSISAAVRPLGLRFPPTLGGGNHRRERKRTQPNRCRELRVNVCLCMCALYFCTPVDSKKLRMRASAHAFVRCVWVYLRVRDASASMCVCGGVLVCVRQICEAANTWGRGVLPAYRWASNSASLPLSPAQTPHQLRASPFQSLP